ncbi:MAG: tetratricopeptide repeat protein [Alphaproteobacteria bacterium]|nr:MAG: tetratricopeptide repeat protein [Alphaproteobacteria bacterium]
MMVSVGMAFRRLPGVICACYKGACLQPGGGAMMRYLVVLVLGLCWCAGAYGAEPFESKIEIGTQYSLNSALLGEGDLRYSVSLPESYDSVGANATYPVIYVLDGYLTQFETVRAAALANNKMGSLVPEAIVVGLPSPNRVRDYTPVHSLKNSDGTDAPFLEDSGGAEAYRRHLREELLPLIEAKYRTKPYRVLVGHSFGGLFAIHDMLSADPLFEAYIAIDPSLWYAGGLLLDEARKAAASPAFKGGFYMSYIPHPEDAGSEGRVIDFLALIEALGGGAIRTRQQFFEHESHQSVQFVSYHEGLRHVFEGYAPPGIEAAAKDPDLLFRHYADYSARMGVAFEPDPFYVSVVAYNALYYYRWLDKAEQLFKANLEAHPGISGAWNGIAEYYHAAGRDEDAKAALQHALELNPDDDYAKSLMARFGFE